MGIHAKAIRTVVPCHWAFVNVEKIKDVQERRIPVKMELVCAVQILLAQIHQILVLMENAYADQPYPVLLDIIAQMVRAKTLVMVSFAPRTRIPVLMGHVNAAQQMFALGYRIPVLRESVNVVPHQLVTQHQVTNARMVNANAATMRLVMAAT